MKTCCANAAASCVTLADVDLKQGLQPKSPYCEIPLDLTEALGEMQ